MHYPEHKDFPAHQKIMFNNYRYQDSRYKQIASHVDLDWSRGSPCSFRWMYTYQILLASGCMFDDMCGDPVL